VAVKAVMPSSSCRVVPVNSSHHYTGCPASGKNPGALIPAMHKGLPM
jgi:hypothetical protein